jgi:cell division protein FtsA
LETLLVEPFGEGMPTEIKRTYLSEIIEARVEEIFEFVHKEIKRSGYDGLLRAGAVITGGVSQLPGIREVAQNVLRLPVRLAKPEKLTGMADALMNPSYSTSVGLLRLGLDMDTVATAIPDENGAVQGSRFGQFLRGLLRPLLPDDSE